MDAAWSDDPIVGIVDERQDGPSPAEENERAATAILDVGETIRSAGATAVRSDLESVLEATPSLLVAVGDATVAAVVRADVDVPVLPVGDVTGIDAVPAAKLPAALEAILGTEPTSTRWPVLGVTVTDADGRTTRARALFDVTLVTEQPGHISEYGVSSRGEGVATFRADGVVAATPAGSHGYVDAVAATRLSAAVDALAVAPIAPFVMQRRQWVLPDDRLTLSVERNEADVAAVVDGRPVVTVGIGSRATVGVDGTLPVLSVPDDALER